MQGKYLKALTANRTSKMSTTDSDDLFIEKNSIQRNIYSKTTINK